ncbi:MAG: GNAT family N-acetyltransferase [Pseudomonadota bacterium]
MPGYLDALERGWSPDNLRADAAKAHLADARADPEAVFQQADDPDAAGPPIILPDGSSVPRLPSLTRWVWRDGFCGVISLRWQPGTTALPPTCAGHVGYAIVPWRRRQGLASAALSALLPLARRVGLDHVDLTTAPTNRASIRVIEKAGGHFVADHTRPDRLGGGRAEAWRIPLSAT